MKEPNAIHVQNVLLQGINLLLRSDKTVFWPDEKLLILADTHFGKAAHFRKNGIPVPAGVMDENLAILDKALDETRAETVLVVGDLFHSRNNTECAYFFDWLAAKNLKFQLVKGNHDILPKIAYDNGRIEIFNDSHKLGPFTFRHHPPEINEELNGAYLLCGHIHPAYTLTGKARQSLRFPCFYLGQKFALLPAFGRFTGLHSIEKLDENDEVYLLADNRLIKA